LTGGFLTFVLWCCFRLKAKMDEVQLHHDPGGFK
jgi:hypothetical protein